MLDGTIHVLSAATPKRNPQQGRELLVSYSANLRSADTGIWSPAGVANAEHASKACCMVSSGRAGQNNGLSNVQAWSCCQRCLAVSKTPAWQMNWKRCTLISGPDRYCCS
jgi:hypothetical protein